MIGFLCNFRCLCSVLTKDALCRLSYKSKGPVCRLCRRSFIALPYPLRTHYEKRVISAKNRVVGNIANKFFRGFRDLPHSPKPLPPRASMVKLLSVVHFLANNSLCLLSARRMCRRRRYHAAATKRLQVYCMQVDKSSVIYSSSHTAAEAQKGFAKAVAKEQ